MDKTVLFNNSVVYSIDDKGKFNRTEGDLSLLDPYYKSEKKPVVGLSEEYINDFDHLVKQGFKVFSIGDFIAGGIISNDTRHYSHQCILSKIDGSVFGSILYNNQLISGRSPVDAIYGMDFLSKDEAETIEFNSMSEDQGYFDYMLSNICYCFDPDRIVFFGDFGFTPEELKKKTMSLIFNDKPEIEFVRSELTLEQVMKGLAG